MIQTIYIFIYERRVNKLTTYFIKLEHHNYYSHVCMDMKYDIYFL